MTKAKDFFNYYSNSHAYAEYSFIKTLIWKIGVLRRLFGDIRSNKKHLFINLEKLNQKHRIKSSRPALILAGGPSINEIDEEFVNSFKNFGDTFSINYFPLSKLGAGCYIDYHVMLDVDHFTEYPAEEMEGKFRLWLQSEFKGKLITQIGANVNYRGDTVWLRCLTAPSFTKSINPMKLLVGFPPYTTLYAISAAIWLGYKPIYVSGLDASQHAFIKESDGKIILGTHHANDAHPSSNRSWGGRPDSTSILSSNAYVIEKMKLFKNHSVKIIGSGSHVDTIPRISTEKILMKHLKVQ